MASVTVAKKSRRKGVENHHHHHQPPPTITNRNSDSCIRYDEPGSSSSARRETAHHCESRKESKKPPEKTRSLHSDNQSINEERPLVEEARCEREARSIAIERAYVHDVYEQISQHLSDTRYRAWPRVKQFLQDLEPGSILCDVGCGCGKYLDVNSTIYNIGSDRCKALTQIAREKDHEVMLCDNLSLPFRDESLDAVLSVAVIHHVATAERRVRALRELARVVRVGGRVMISVWAMEQRHRKFGSQDVLIPWHKPLPANNPGGQSGSSSSGKVNQTGNHVSRRSVSNLAQVQQKGRCTTTNTTTTTSEDDVTHYYAYTQTTTSDSGGEHYNQNNGSSRSGLRRRHKNSNRKGRSMDPGAQEIFSGQPVDEFYPQSLYQSSSDLSSPNSETCYSFVRKAIQKLSVPNRRQVGSCSSGGRPATRVPWFNLAGGLEHWVGGNQQGDATTYDAWQEGDGRSLVTREDSGESNDSIGDLPIELPHLEGDLGVDHQMLWSSFVLERRKHDPNFTLNGKSKSLDDLIQLSSEASKKSKNVSLLEMGRANTYDDQTALDRERVTELDYLLFRSGGVRYGHWKHFRNEIKERDEDHLEEYEDEMDDEFPEEDEIELAVSGILRDLKKTLSASLRSIDFPIRSGSLTSISSGKSIMSNFSVKSDSGINLPVSNSATKKSQNFLAKRTDTKKQNKLDHRRSWDSEPMLESSQPSPHRRSRSMNSGDVDGSFDLPEKSKVMMGIESKVMKAIKEVNESDFSETNTPVNSPFLPLVTQQSSSACAPPTKRPLLVKQKRSFHASDEDEDVVMGLSVDKEDDEDQNVFCDNSETCNTIEKEENESEATNAKSSEHVGATEGTNVPDNEKSMEMDGSEIISPTPKRKSGFVLSDVSFEELKIEVQRMPAIVTARSGCSERGRSCSEGGVGSITESLQLKSEQQQQQHQHQPRGNTKKSTIRQQYSLNDELLSRERLQANQEVRKGIRKQQSLPDDQGRSAPKKYRTLRESFLMAVKRGTTLENIKNSFSLFRVPEEEDPSAIEITPPPDGSGPVEVITEEEPETSEDSKEEISVEPKPEPQVPSIRTGIARIWQSWRSGDSANNASSFTHKRGVTIQPINVIGGYDGCGSATPPPSSANRRSIFQRRLVGGSSPISPKQLEALTKENVDTLSPTLRRCCMDCPGGDLIRERKMSRSEASDSSKDGSIQSDTSIDSEDSCVSVIFVPHPENKHGIGQVDQTGSDHGIQNSELLHQRSAASNSSESSESVHSAGSGRGSPLSPGNRLGSPVKGSNGKTMVVLKTSTQLRQIDSLNLRNSRDDDIVFLDRPLEKIDEKHESESETEEVVKSEIVSEEKIAECTETDKAPIEVTPQELEPVEEEEAEIPTNQLDKKPSEEEKVSDSPEKTIAKLQRRMSEHKSFEMEDIPRNESPILCHPASRAKKRLAAIPTKESQKHKFDYPIVRHHPLFAKQRRDGNRSNFSSLLLGENVRIIRRRVGQPFEERGKDGNMGSLQGGFEIFNPETDDLDSEDEDDDRSSSDSSQESVVSAPNKSENEKLERFRQTLSLDEASISADDVGWLDPELKLRSDRRKISLMSLLDENQTVISNIEKKRRRPGFNRDISTDDKSEDSTTRSDSSDVARVPTLRRETPRDPVRLSCSARDAKCDSNKNKVATTSSAETSDTANSEAPKLTKKVCDSAPVTCQLQNKGSHLGLDVTPTASTGAIPKHHASVILPSIVVPPSSSGNRGRLGKARSVSPSSSAAKERLLLNVKRQSSVPTKFEEVADHSSNNEESTNKLLGTSLRPNETNDKERKVTLAHLEVSPSGSDLSAVTRSSRESLSGGCGSKSPSPSRLSDHGSSANSANSGDSLPKCNQSEKGPLRVSRESIEKSQRKRRVSGPASTRKSSLEPVTAGSSNKGDDAILENGKSIEEARDQLEEGLLQSRPPGSKRISCREDSVESSGGKSSIHYSDTSSLLSHRFSTISISSNVSSEVSSSCYLASMSSADFDDRPVMASSISLDEADEGGEYGFHQHPLVPQLPPQQQQHRTHHERMRRLKSLFRRTNPNNTDLAAPSEIKEETDKKHTAALKEDDMEEDSVMSNVDPSSHLVQRHGRSRIGTETSVENPTCIENPDRSNSFEEELFRGLPRDDHPEENDDDDVLTDDQMNRTSGQRLSAASSSESINSDGGGGSLIHHRYYHVFREGELDYLISTYVDNLHIISSYYDHANWCVIAEKVNVWTI